MAAMLPGLTGLQLQEWSDFDNVSDAACALSDPPVGFELHSFALSSGMSVVVLDIAEFETVPHVCKRDYLGVLQDASGVYPVGRWSRERDGRKAKSGHRFLLW